MANKRAELEIRRHEIEANKEIALASIAAQKDDIVKRGDVFASVQKGRLWLFGGIAFLVAIVIIFAMYTGQTDIAIKLIEIGGAVLLGYFAGFHRGKAQALEAQNNRQNTSE